MKRTLTVLGAVLAVCAGIYVLTSQWAKNDWQDGDKTRPAYASGSFYPADPTQLGLVVDSLLASVQPQKFDGPLVALIAPHAGYSFSGQVAAQAYALLRGRSFKRVVVIAPSHFEYFPFAAIYDGDAYTTPFGKVLVDKAFAARLAKSHPLLKLSDFGHRYVNGHGEHAIEDELPFLQRTLGAFKVVPIIMGEQNYTLEHILGRALAEAIGVDKDGGDPDTLIVASSDLSHYYTYDQAVQRDRKVIDAIAEDDIFSLSKNFESGVWEACGGGPIVAAMIAARRLGANSNVILKYANSGDVTGDKSRVVGYASAALWQSKAPPDPLKQPSSLTSGEQMTLLTIAKKSVETAVRQHKIYELPGGFPQTLTMPRGAFVTLRQRGALRGCVGYTTSSKSMVETVRDVAALAAVKDSRFSPVTPEELDRLDYDISVLSPLYPLNDAREIRLGSDGLVIRKGSAEGLFLPQVPTEQGWDRTTFLEQLGVKAGLSKDAWHDPDADLFRFTATVFEDKDAQEKH